MTRDDGRRLRRELSRHARGRGKRYGAELRARVVAFAERRRRAGASWASIGEELGMKFESVRRWCLREATSTAIAMRAVEVVPEASGRVRVVCVGGLTVEQAAEILRALG